MTTKPILDLGPFFPKRPTAVIPNRDDGAAEGGPSGLAEGDMNTGASKGGYNSPGPEDLPYDPATQLPRPVPSRKVGR